MHIVYVHDAKIVKENGLTLQFCSNYPPKMSRICAMYTFLTNYNTIGRRFSPNERKILKSNFYLEKLPIKVLRLLTFPFLFCIFEEPKQEKNNMSYIKIKT